MNNLNFKAIIREDLTNLSDLQPDGWENIKIKFEYYLNNDFCHPIKLLLNKKIVGIGSVIVHEDIAWLGHIIVHHDHRKKGYGKLITQELIAIAHSESCKSIQLIATDMGAPVYASIGFIEDTAYLFYKEVSIPKTSIMNVNIEKFNATYKRQILLLDKCVSGENRICEIEPHLHAGYVYLSNNMVEGYCLPTLGQGLIIAKNEIAGTELLKEHLKSTTTIVFPKENQSAQSFLYAQGFLPYATAKRMYMGENIDVKFKNIYNRIAGNIG